MPSLQNPIPKIKNTFLRFLPPPPPRPNSTSSTVPANISYMYVLYILPVRRPGRRALLLWAELLGRHHGSDTIFAILLFYGIFEFNDFYKFKWLKLQPEPRAWTRFGLRKLICRRQSFQKQVPQHCTLYRTKGNGKIGGCSTTSVHTI